MRTSVLRAPSRARERRHTPKQKLTFAHKDHKSGTAQGPVLRRSCSMARLQSSIWGIHVLEVCHPLVVISQVREVLCFDCAALLRHWASRSIFESWVAETKLSGGAPASGLKCPLMCGACTTRIGDSCMSRSKSCCACTSSCCAFSSAACAFCSVYIAFRLAPFSAPGGCEWRLLILLLSLSTLFSLRVSSPVV